MAKRKELEVGQRYAWVRGKYSSTHPAIIVATEAWREGSNSWGRRTGPRFVPDDPQYRGTGVAVAVPQAAVSSWLSKDKDVDEWVPHVVPLNQLRPYEATLEQERRQEEYRREQAAKAERRRAERRRLYDLAREHLPELHLPEEPPWGTLDSGQLPISLVRVAELAEARQKGS